MTDIVALVPQPEAPCKQCVETARHQEETIGIVYCHHTRYGGIYTAENGMWQISGPYADENAFKRAIYFNLSQILSAQTH